MREVFTLRLWPSFAALLLVVVTIWFALSFYLLPYGLRWFVNALVLGGAGGFFIASKWLR